MIELIIGVDLDGVLTTIGLYNTETKLPWWCALWLILVKPNKKMAEIVRGWQEKNNEIVIVSSRPRQLEAITRWWLKKHQISFSQLFFVGKGKGVAERKFEIIQKIGIECFVDDDPRTVNFLRRFGVNARFPQGASF